MCSVLLVLSVLFAGSFVEAQAQGLVTGRRFQQALKVPMTVQFAGYPLRNILSDLQQQTGIAILRDRRVNPNQKPSVAIENASRQEAMQQIAKGCGARIQVVENVVVMLPANQQVNLSNLVQRLRKSQLQMRGELPSKVLSGLARKRPCQWPRLTEPRAFLLQRADEVGLSIVNPEVIPHDLWPAAELPSANFATIATLILSQFDLTYQLNGDATLKIVPIAEETR